MARTPPENPDGIGTEEVRQDAERARETARHDWSEASAQVRKDFDDVKQEARREFDHAREAAGGYAEAQKNHAAEQIEGLASAFGRVQSELKDGDQSWAGHYAGDIAGRLEWFANHTRSSSIDDLVHDVERFGREQPAAFLAGAALLGFAATRFFSASSRRRSHSQRTGHDSSSSSAAAPSASTNETGDQ